MNLPAREGLTVFIDGEEVPGIIVYALRSAGSSTKVDLSTDVWAGADVRSFRLHGEAWEILRWDLALRCWPVGDDWLEAVRRTLTHLLDAGAVVAWVGAEGSPFSDPPDLFSPEWMTGSVLAAMTSAEFLCPIDPDLPLRTLSDDELVRLRSHSHGLSDALS